MVAAWFQMSVAIAASAVFFYIAWVDFRTMEIPDWCHVALIAIGMVQWASGSGSPLDQRAIALIVMAFPIFVANLIRRDCFGGGDLKMCASAGFLLGLVPAVTGALVALVLAGVYGSVALLTGRKRRQDSFPLGPFLSLGFVIEIADGLVNGL